MKKQKTSKSRMTQRRWRGDQSRPEMSAHFCWMENRLSRAEEAETYEYAEKKNQSVHITETRRFQNWRDQVPQKVETW